MKGFFFFFPLLKSCSRTGTLLASMLCACVRVYVWTARDCLNLCAVSCEDLEVKEVEPDPQATEPNGESSRSLLSKDGERSDHVTAQAADLQALSFSFSSVSRIRTWRSVSPHTLGKGSSTKAWSCGESPCRSIPLPGERKGGVGNISSQTHKSIPFQRGNLHKAYTCPRGKVQGRIKGNILLESLAAEETS